MLDNRKDIRFEVLFNWSFICFSTIKDINNIFLALKLIELSSKDVEEKRKLSHKEERASIGAQAEKIYKLYVDICSILLNIISNENLKNYIMHKIEVILPKLSPRSIIEQKNYNNENKITSEAIRLENEYKLRIEEYKSMQATEENNTDLKSKKAEEIEYLKQKLMACHPYYMELKEYKSLSFSEVQDMIKENEIIFQSLLTMTGIVIIIISKFDIVFEHKYLVLDKNNMRELTKKFSEHMQLSNLNQSEMKNITNVISGLIGEKLYEYIDKKNIKRVFNVPNFNLKMFSLPSLFIDGKHLIDKVDSIINIIDYTSITDFKRSLNINGMIANIIGNSNDLNLLKIKKWITKIENSKIILNEKLDDLNKYCSTENPFNAIAIFSHGVQDPTSNLLLGAKGIDGGNNIIILDNIIDSMLLFEYIILISCSTGSPNTEQIEESYGTLSTLLEKFNGNMILCRWNVSTIETIELLDYTFKLCFDKNMDLDKSLIFAQRHIKENHSDNQYWAGIEFWIN